MRFQERQSSSFQKVPPVGIIVRQSLKASFGFYVGALIGVINQMFVSTHFLSVEQLALSRLLIENAILFGTFSTLGAPFIADKFFGAFRDDTKGHHGLLVFLLFLPLFGGLVFTLIYSFFTPEIKGYFARQSPLLLDYHYLVIPLTFLSMYVLIFEAYCRNHSRIAIPSFVREVFLRLSNVLLILMFGLGWYSFDTLLYLILASYAAAIGILVYYVARLGKLYLRWPDAGKFNRDQIGVMLGYGGFTIIGGLGVGIMLFLDRTMLAGEKGLVSAGIFIIASYISNLIEIPKKAISQISIPLVSDALRVGNHDHVRVLTQKSALHQLLAGGLFFLLICTNLDELFRIIPKGDTYGDGKYVVVLLLFAKLFDISTGLNTEIIFYSRFFRWATLFLVVAAAASFLLNLWLIPLYGFMGAAFATVLATLGLSMSKLIFVWKHFHIQPFSKKTVLVVILLGLLYLLTSSLPALPYENLWEMIVIMAIRSLILVVLFAFAVLRLRISPEISALAGRLLKSIS